MGVNWDDVGLGLAGALNSGLDHLSFQQQHEQRDRAIDSREEVARLQAELRAMIAEAQIAGRREVAGMNNATRETVANTAAGSRENVATINATSREGVADKNNATRFDIASMFEVGRNARHDRPSGNVTAQQAGANQRQATGHTNRMTVESFLEGGRNTRAKDANTLRVQENDKNREVERERLRRRADPFAGLFDDAADPLTEVIEGTGRPTAEPIEVESPPTTDRPLPRSPEAANDQLTRLSEQITSLMEQIKTAPTAAQRNALRRQLRPILDQYKAAGGQ